MIPSELDEVSSNTNNLRDAAHCEESSDAGNGENVRNLDGPEKERWIEAMV